MSCVSFASSHFPELSLRMWIRMPMYSMLGSFASQRVATPATPAGSPERKLAENQCLAGLAALRALRALRALPPQVRRQPEARIGRVFDRREDGFTRSHAVFAASAQRDSQGHRVKLTRMQPRFSGFSMR